MVKLGSGCKYSKTPSRLDFFEIVLKVEKNTKDFPVKWTQIKFKGNSLIIFFRGPIYLWRIFHVNLKAISIFWWKAISYFSLFFKANELTRTRSLFLPSGSIDNPTQMAPPGACYNYHQAEAPNFRVNS